MRADPAIALHTLHQKLMQMSQQCNIAVITISSRLLQVIQVQVKYMTNGLRLLLTLLVQITKHCAKAIRRIHKSTYMYIYRGV